MRKRLRKYLPDHTAVHDNKWLAPFADTLLHPRLWHLNRHSAAGAVAVGLFCGLIPGPLQMFGAVICALLFRVNLPLALFTTLYTNPLTIVPLYIVAFELGKWVLPGEGEAFVVPPDYAGSFFGWVEALVNWMLQLGKPLAVGLVLLAALLSVAGYLVMRLAYRYYLVRAWRHRAQRRPE